MAEGRRPLITASRLGLQAGAAQWAFVNSTPRAARRSRFGVCVSGCPPPSGLRASVRQPSQSFRSSTATNSTSGRPFASCENPDDAAASVRSRAAGTVKARNGAAAGIGGRSGEAAGARANAPP